MHLTDTLDAGGLERVAVNTVNLLPRDRYVPHLCTTRRDGPLADLVSDDVRRLRMNRKGRFDVGALWRLREYIKDHRIGILHAHGSALFVASIASLISAHATVIWHDHYGRYLFDDRPVWLYRLATGAVSGVITVNQQLADWSKQKLRVSSERVWYIPNLVCEPKHNGSLPELPGKKGARILCVANFRPQKDHHNLIRAMSIVVKQEPSAHLLLVGTENDKVYLDSIKQEASRLGLDRHVSFLGERRDVPSIVRACDIGVLSSASEGLPLSLLEYGLVGLPAVTTDVGQCAEVLDNGRAGVLVPAAAPEKLAEALIDLLRSPEKRATLGEEFQQRVQEFYSPDAVMRQICKVYETVLAAGVK